MAYADQVPGARRFTTIAGVALIHGIIGYAFVTGMVVDVVRGVTRTLTTTNVPLPVEPPPPQPKEPPRVQQPVRQTAASTATPIVNLPRAIEPIYIEPLPLARPDPLPIATGTPQPQPSVTPASRASGVRVRGERASWITNDDYPPSAIRAEEQGTVAITVAVDADGRVSTCSVTQSSGSAALDQATCRLYAKRARFDAARDDGGARVASTYSDRVRWQLPR
ncbi:energy transducer TonB [Sphingomonas adhaesiva]|uniref:energy transducer TonB n=1 Tax=Sphingomonas adhaesiva TaxID=28212 RepID=UPI002FF9427E